MSFINYDNEILMKQVFLILPTYFFMTDMYV